MLTSTERSNRQSFGSGVASQWPGFDVVVVGGGFLQCGSAPSVNFSIVGPSVGDAPTITTSASPLLAFAMRSEHLSPGCAFASTLTYGGGALTTMSSVLSSASVRYGTFPFG